MTFLFPTWVESIVRFGIIYLLLLFYGYIVIYIYKMLKKKENVWVAALIIIPAVVGTILFLENQYKVIYPIDYDIVINGKGEIVGNTLNKRLATTDNDLFVYKNSPIPQDTVVYTFDTKDGQEQEVEILLTYPEADVETIIKFFHKYKEVAEATENNESIDYFANLYYYQEIVEDEFERYVSQQIGGWNKEDVTNDVLAEVIETFMTEKVQEHEKEFFTIEWNEEG